MIPIIPADVSGAVQVLIYFGTAVAAVLSVLFTSR